MRLNPESPVSFSNNPRSSGSSHIHCRRACTGGQSAGLNSWGKPGSDVPAAARQRSTQHHFVGYQVENQDRGPLGSAAAWATD